MKNACRIVLTAVLVSLGVLRAIGAADLTWDTSPDGGIQGGSGDWDTTATNWTTDGGSTRAAWDNTANATDTAVFGTAVGTVNVTESINLGGLRFTVGGATGYVLSGVGSLDFGGAQGSIDTSALPNSSDNNTTLSVPLSGTGGVTIAANGDLSASGGSSNTALLLTGDNSGLSGGMTITGGLVSYASATATFGTNQITLNGGGIVNRNAGTFTLANDFVIDAGGGTFRNWSTGATTFTGAFSGSGTLRKTDTGTMTVSPAANSIFSGAFQVVAGTVTIGTNVQATGTGSLLVNGRLNSYSANATYSTTYGNSAISVTGGLWTFGGSSPGTVTHTYNFTGEIASTTATDPATAIQVSNGTLTLSSSNTTTKNFNGRINWSGANTINRTSSNFTHTTNWNRAWYGSGTLTINKTGGASGRTMNFAGAGSDFGGTVILNNTQASGGSDPVFNLNQSVGTAAFEVRNRWNLRANAAGVLDASTGVTISSAASQLTLTQPVTNTGLALAVNAGTVTVGDALSTVGSLSGTGGTITASGVSSALTVTQSSDADYAGTITGTLALSKLGAARLTLSGANTYAGATAVSAGTLVVNGSIASISLTTVASGATLGGSGSVGGTLIEGGGFHAPGTSPGIQTVTNGLEYQSGATLVWELFANTAAGRGTDYDGIDLTGGSLVVDSGAILALDFGTSAGGSTVDWNDSFWGSDQSWTIIDVGASATWDGSLFGVVSVGPDASGQSLASVRPSAGFSVGNVGGDLTLQYVAVPEPATLALVGIAAGVLAAVAGRRRGCCMTSRT